MERIAVEAQALKEEFVLDIDRDTDALSAVMAARRLPKATDDERVARDRAVDAVNRGATLVPLGVLRRAVAALKIAAHAAARGNTNSLSDAGVAAPCGLACAEGEFCKVRINLKGMSADSAGFASEAAAEAQGLLIESPVLSDAIRHAVRGRLG